MSDTNLKLEIGGMEDQGKPEAPKPKAQRFITLDQVIGWLKGLGYDATITDILIQKAKKYPSGSYHQFHRDIKRHVRNAQIGK